MSDYTPPVILDGFAVFTDSRNFGRALPEVIRDLNNVRDFGAVLDGIHDDTRAFICAYQSTPTNGIIWIPFGESGKVNLQPYTAWGIDTSRQVYWQTGATYKDGSSLAGYLPGSTSGPQPGLAVESITQNVNWIGGNNSLFTTFSVITNANTNINDNFWSFFTQFNSSAVMHDWTQTQTQVNVYHQMVRMPLPTGTTVSATSSGASVFVAETKEFIYAYAQRYAQPVSPSNPLPITVNGRSYSVIGVSAQSGPGILFLSSPLVGGDGTQGNAVVPTVVGVRLINMVSEMHEFTDAPTSVSGPAINTELDMAGNGLDDIDFRAFFSLDISQNNPSGSVYEVGNVFGIYGSTNAYAKRILQVNTPYSQAVIDTRNATRMSGANTIWLKSGDNISFGTDGSRYWFYNLPAANMEYHVGFGGGPNFWITDAGVIASTGGAAFSGPIRMMTSFLVPSGTAALDLRSPILQSGGNTIWLPSGGTIALDASGVNTLFYDPGTNKVFLANNGTHIFSIDPLGNVRALGTITPSVTP